MTDNTDTGKQLKEIESFDELGLKENLLRGLYSYGFENPSPIQKKAIKPMIEGNNLIAQAPSGTGKTGTFSVGILQRINEKMNGCQAIIISPTRELAMQITDVIENISKYMKEVDITTCVKGSIISKDLAKIRKGSQVVIGTPGRLIHMINKKMLSTSRVKLLVVDEADNLLSEGFLPQLQEIVESLYESCQICLFSATMPKEEYKITQDFLENPVEILVEKEKLSLDGIKQFFIDVEYEEGKFGTLCDLYGTITINQSMIYVNSKRRADWLKKELLDKNFTVSMIHSDMTPTERSNIMKSFRNGDSRILISTDLLARGIDVQHVSIVLNYDIPRDKENYLHRIGRSGRFGRKGVSINFVTKRDFRLMKGIEAYYNKKIEPMPVDIQKYI